MGPETLEYPSTVSQCERQCQRRASLGKIGCCEFQVDWKKCIWFDQSFAFSFNCEIGLCLLRDKMKHSIVVVCPLFKAYWK